MSWGTILIYAISSAIIADIIATYRGANPNHGLLAGFLLGPIGIIVAFILPIGVQKGKTKKCPYCAEIIKTEAKICKYCGKELM